MPKAIFNSKENRLAVFSEFLLNRFGKPAAEVTKEELLSLRATDFKDEKWRITTLGSAATLYSWYEKNHKGSNILYSLLSGLGYADNITEQEIATVRTKISSGKTKYENLAVVKKVFDAFFASIHPDGQMSKERLIAIGKNRYEKTGGEAHGLLMHYYWKAKKLNAENPGSTNAHFLILTDLGYAQLHGIGWEDVKEAGAKRMVSGRESAYSDKKKRAELFAEFLANHFQKSDTSQVTKDELLSLRYHDLLNTKATREHWSLHSLFGWYVRNRSSTMVLFEIFYDLGYATRFGITKKEVKKAVSRHMSESIRAAKRRKLTARDIVVVSQGPGIERPKPPLILPEVLRVRTRGPVGSILVVVSSHNNQRENDQREKEQPATGAAARQPSLLMQAIKRHFGSIEIIGSYNPMKKLAGAQLDSTFAIVSKYPLDEIFKHGLELMGYRITASAGGAAEENLVFSTDDAVVNTVLAKRCVTKIERVEIRAAAHAILFKNDYLPDKIALHELGHCARQIPDARSLMEVDAIETAAKGWLSRIESDGIVGAERFSCFKETYEEKL
ncbi:hypothetical protein J4441_03190, partial [Candidatus Micrarchaeota archaeon]|nr:hypothetical protein [Candidatus Micrarchaeota archaeon]